MTHMADFIDTIHQGEWVVVEVNDGNPHLVAARSFPDMNEARRGLVFDYIARGIETDEFWLFDGIAQYNGRPRIQADQGDRWLHFSDGKGTWDVWIWKLQDPKDQF